MFTFSRCCCFSSLFLVIAGAHSVSPGILYCRRPKIVIAVQSVAATMAGSSAVGLAAANASLQASWLQQYVRVFQTSAKRYTHTHRFIKRRNNNAKKNENCRLHSFAVRAVLRLRCHANANCPAPFKRMNK